MATLTAAAAISSASAQALDTQLLTDPGLNSSSQPLLSFGQPVLARWMQENAVLVNGAQPSGVVPFEGNGMVAISQTGGVVSQVRQRVDVSSLATDIDTGLVGAIAIGWLNASAAGTIGFVQVTTFDANQVLTGTMSDGGLVDGNASTWEPRSAQLQLPVGTRFVECQFLFNNASLPPGETGYGDGAALVLSRQVLTAASHINAHTMLEATASGYQMIQQDLGIDPVSTFTWSGTFDDSGWTSSVTGTIYGTAFTLSYVGSASTLPSGDVLVSFSASGLRGVDAIHIAGTASWRLDTGTGRFDEMEYNGQGTLFVGAASGGMPRMRWWKRALEVVGGGLAGGLVGGVTGAGPLGIGVGVLLGALYGLQESNSIANVNTTGGAPSQPPLPGAPTLPATGANIVLGPDQLFTSVTGAGALEANLMNEVAMTGSWSSGGVASGTGSVTSVPVAQQSLTTTFANNNGGAAGGCLYFTLTAGVADVTITSIDFNIQGGGGVASAMDIYTTPNTHLGAELSPGLWTLHGAATVAATSPVGTGSPADLSANPLTIMANTSVGIACADPGAAMAHAYTTGTAPFPVQFTGCSLTLDAGSASNSPFTGTIFTPRVANVTINYAAAGDCATLESVGTGCVTAFSSAYELGTLDVFGLSNTMTGIDFISTGGGYIITPAAGTIAAVGSVDPAAVPLAGVPDDGLVPVGTQGFEISSNGYFTTTTGGSNAWIPTGDLLVNNAGPTFANWSDFQPNTGGTITAEEAGTITQVTYTDVLAWGTTDLNTFQFHHDSASGNASLYFGAMASATAHAHLVGYSPGGGVANPGALASGIEAELTANGAIVLSAGDTLPLTIDAARPVMGAAAAPYDVTTTNIEAGALFHVGVLGVAQIPGGISIPGTDPSCLLHIGGSILTSAAVVAGGPGNLTWTALTLPAVDPALNGFAILIQGVTLDLTLIGPSLRMSNALFVTLGDL